MVEITIDGQPYEAREDETVLAVARAVGVDIPALCYHPAVTPYGACRLCLVEAKQRGRTRIVTSCCYPVRDGLEVSTSTERVQRARRGVMELLLARAPQSATLQRLAVSMGITSARFPTVTHAERDCILCGLCVSVCRDVIGAAAISFAYRGVDRAVAPPFLQSAEACIGCGACAAVCPMGTIELTWTNGQVEIAPFKTRVEAAHCQDCGSPLPGAPFTAALLTKIPAALAKAAMLCDECKRERAAVIARKVGLLAPMSPATARLRGVGR